MGKKTRNRACPAAGREITAAECGAGRHTTYACPEECPFNPFSAAKYGEFSRIEHPAEAKLLEWMVANVPDPTEFKRGLERVIGTGPNVPYFHWLAWHGVFATGPDGETCMGKWAKAGFPGMTGDERVYLRGRSQMRPAMIEVRRVLDQRRTEVVDLLDPERKPVLVVDQSFAGQAIRFGVYGVYLMPLPNYCRIFGACTSVPDLFPLAPEEVIRELISHLGGSTDEAGMRGFLAQHFERFEEALMAVALARRKAMFEQLDAQFGKAVYRLIQPYQECRARLDSLANVAAEPPTTSEQAEGFIEARAWYARPDDPEVAAAGQDATLGRVLLGPTHWRLEAMGADKLGRLRQRFEPLMAGGVRFAGERRDDLGARLRAEEAAYDPALVPPALLKDPPKLLLAVSRVPLPAEPASPGAVAAEFEHQRDREFLDAPIPGLDGRTPRQAASDPALRPKLLQLMKSRIQAIDQRNLETGRNDDLNWMVRELGLNEILFAPPPPRPALGRGRGRPG